MRHYSRSLSISLACIAFAACSDYTAPLRPNVKPAVDNIRVRPAETSRPRTIDDEFEDLVQTVPGFGGLYYDAAGTLHVFLKNKTIRNQIGAALATFLTERNAALLPAKQREVASMVVEKGNFDYRELGQWYRRLSPIFGTMKIIMTDIDEAHNGILLGVADDNARAAVVSKLASFNPPAGMVTVQTVQPVYRIRPAMRTAGSASPDCVGCGNANLQGVVRPVPASVELDNGGRGCTLGWNAKYRDNINGYDHIQYFVTVSHCSPTMWGYDGSSFGQPDASNPIGNEVADPPPFDNSTDASCPFGYICRYSDATLVRYNPGVSWNYGHFPNIDNVIPYPITGYHLFATEDGQWGQVPPDLYVGMTLQKTGYHFGRTDGTMLHTCIGLEAYDPGPTGQWLICQFQAAGLDNYPGDSGSPIYHLDSQGNADPLMGILWGAQYDNGVFNAPLRTTFSHVWYASRELANAMGGGWLDIHYGACVYPPGDSNSCRY